MKEAEKRFGTLSGWGAAAVAILVWGVTFANTRVLLEDFSALEINLIRFGLAWLALWGVAVVGKCGRRWPSAVLLRSAVRASDPTECDVADCGGRRDARPTEGGEVSCSRFVFAAMGLTGVAAYQFLENCAIYYTNACNVAILVSFGPIVTAVMARAWTNDRSLSLRLVLGSLVTVRKSFGVAVAMRKGRCER